ncbi:hypothetical protein PWT90_05314 [Aphanocladium album]|nr:hypothetical protein PWT90_05314 [Aphanocladium album]
MFSATAQLARKRANDREAQRAMRARTRGYIERLESELKNLRGLLCHDDAVQALWDQNKALIAELASLRGTLRAHANALQRAEAQGGPYARGKLYGECSFSSAAEICEASDGFASLAQPPPTPSLWESPGSQHLPTTACVSSNADLQCCLFPPQMDCCQKSVMTESYGKVREICGVPWSAATFNNMGIGVGGWDASNVSVGPTPDSNYWPLSSPDQIIRNRA